MSYKFTMTRGIEATLQWVGHRYGWSADFPLTAKCAEVGETVDIPEHEMWEWKESVDASDDSLFSCLDMRSETGATILALYESIV